MAATVPPYNNLNFVNVVEIPGLHIVNREYSSGFLIYMGHAVMGSSASDEKWVIRKYTYTSNQLTSERVAVGVAWNDRTTVTYT